MSRTMSTTVPLPQDLGIEHSRTLHALLAGHVDAEAVSLAAGDVSRVHTATLQVLCAFVSTRAKAGRATAWSEPSAALTEAAARLGIESLLGLAPARAAP